MNFYKNQMTLVLTKELQELKFTLNELQQYSSEYIYMMKAFLTPILENLRDKKHTDEGYIPKQSRRVKLKSTAPPDGDTWTEHVVIVPERLRIEKNKKNRMENAEKRCHRNRYRSYFKSKISNRSVWDEPPSGASNVILFHERKMRFEI